MDYNSFFHGKDQKSRSDCLLHECFIKYNNKYQANHFFANSELNYKIFVKVSLSRENNIGCPSLTDIPLYRALLNTLIKVYTVQKALQYTITKTMIEEFNNWHVGD